MKRYGKLLVNKEEITVRKGKIEGKEWLMSHASCHSTGAQGRGP